VTPRERLLVTLSGGIADCVPVTPDFSNMIPARLTGKPFWDIYLYHDPPISEAYVQAAKYFDIDGFREISPFAFAGENAEGPDCEQFIVHREPERIITQAAHIDGGRRIWAPTVDVYYVANSPTHSVPPEKVGLPAAPTRWEPVEGVKPVDPGPEGLRRIMELMGDQGLVGFYITTSAVLNSVQAIYDYYDGPAKYEREVEERLEQVERRFRYVMSLETKPDFLSVGGSGTLIWQTVPIFRKLAFPVVRRAIELAHGAGIPTHVHSCGPEKELVRIMAEETDLTVIDPLEIPPMGDCDLAKLKRLYGDKIVLKGNLHTTDPMLRGTVEDVIRESRKAIDDAAAGGGFILSTGDQCGRDTPEENLRAMVETARTYGRY